MANEIKGTEASRALCERVALESKGICLLGFSRGKDSIAAWLWLRQFFDRIIPFHCASVPHLRFVDRSLDYYERFFATPVLRCLSNSFTGAMARAVYQDWRDEEENDAMEWHNCDNNDVANTIRKHLGISGVWCAFGINASDSIDRRIYVNKYRGRIESHRNFYPCFDWTREGIFDVILGAGVVLPGDYLLDNRSLSGLPGFRELMRMERVYPDDFARVEFFFPLIRAALARMEFRSRRVARQKTETGAL